jgi:prophage tail gpP-like protein
MSGQPVDPTVQTVVVTANASAPSDDVTVIIAGIAYAGWQGVRITRGVERLPSDFELTLTDIYASEPDALQIKPGDTCVVKIGRDTVLTGYIDVVQIQLNTKSHELHVFGRSKCADLVDCSAEWPGGQIVGSSVLEIARKLASPYGIQVDAEDDPGGPIPQFNLMRGESPFDIIERLCRIRQLLAYDDTDGNLLLATGSTQSAASGFREGINVEAATATFSMHERFSKYLCYLQPVALFQDVGPGSDLISTQVDSGVPRHRQKVLIAESGGLDWLNVAKERLIWEGARRFGRAFIVHLTTDSWRDKAGALYEPNTLVALDLPTLKVTGRQWAISEVTYRRSHEGTRCDLTIMPPDAFRPVPTPLATAIPAEVALLPNGGAR